MSKYYKEIREKFRQDVRDGNCYCILSGLQITNLKDLSLEHYCPICRVSYDIAKQYDNLFPAIKVINHLKSGLLPCEWHAQRQNLLSQAIRKAHNNRDRKIFIDALQNTNFYKINPCTYCVLYETCHLSTKTY